MSALPRIPRGNTTQQQPYEIHFNVEFVDMRHIWLFPPKTTEKNTFDFEGKLKWKHFEQMYLNVKHTVHFARHCIFTECQQFGKKCAEAPGTSSVKKGKR